MSTSKNMPARFESRTHLKNVITMTWNRRRTICNSLTIVGSIRRHYADKLRFITKESKYGLASVKVTYYDAKTTLINTRRFRKSVVLPRLP